MEKTRLNLQWISNEKSIRETSGKPEATFLLFLPQKAGPTQSATQQPALATKWWAPTTHSGLWSLSPCQLLWAWLLHQNRELKCLWSTLPILSGQTFLLCRNPVRIQCANQGETSQFSTSFPDPSGGISGYPPAEHCLVSEAVPLLVFLRAITPPDRGRDDDQEVTSQSQTTMLY